MIILRFTRWNETQYATVEPDKLRAQFPLRLRVKRTINSPIGQMREMEHTGDYHRDRVDLYFSGGRDWFGREVKAGNSNSYASVRLLDHKSHVRSLTDADEQALTKYDAEIARLKEELKRQQTDRREYLKKCWRRARPVGLSELEDRAKADLAERGQS